MMMTGWLIYSMIVSWQSGTVLGAFTSYNTMGGYSMSRSSSGRKFSDVLVLRGKSGGEEGLMELPENEWIRPARLDLLLSPSRRRSYTTQIEAKEEERCALAQRFGLSDITKLEASVELMKMEAEEIQAHGTIDATCTQTCVRTNEDFTVNLEFDFHTLVRPMTTSLQQQQQHPEEEDEEQQQQQQLLDAAAASGINDISQYLTEKKNKKKNKKNMRRNNRRQHKNDPLQDLISIDSMQEEDFDDIIEDDAVWNTSKGILDMGELVAQLFRCKLDPYPKKPGSKPIRYSITG